MRMDIDIPSLEFIIASTALFITVWSFWVHNKLHKQLADCYMKQQALREMLRHQGRMERR